MSEKKTKKVIIIDPVAETVAEGSYDSYEELYDLGNFRIFTVQMVDYNSDTDKGNDLFLDDEGLLKEDQRYFTFHGVGSFAGRGLLIGSDHATGESKDTTWTSDQVKRAVSFEPAGYTIEPYMKFVPFN